MRISDWKVIAIGLRDDATCRGCCWVLSLVLSIGIKCHSRGEYQPEPEPEPEAEQRNWKKVFTVARGTRDTSHLHPRHLYNIIYSTIIVYAYTNYQCEFVAGELARGERFSTLRKGKGKTKTKWNEMPITMHRGSSHEFLHEGAREREPSVSRVLQT